MTAVPIPVARIAAALERGGLLAARHGTLPDSVGGLTDDSRAVEPGWMFVAVRGAERDGHAFLPDAARRGASAFIVEDAAQAPGPALVVRSGDGAGRRAAALAAAAAYDFPAGNLTFAAVTGTNGKTTTVGILRHLLDRPGRPAASIGTLGVLVGRDGAPMGDGAGLTTPGPVELQRVLRSLADAGVGAVAMEVSSHSLDQHRTEGIPFAAAVFTNLTRDHLDYHGSMEKYFAAKARLVGELMPDGAAVVNADDPAWRALPPLPPRSITFGVESRDATVRAEGIRYQPRGSQWTLVLGEERRPVRLPLLGAFNIANALGAAGAAWAMGRTPDEIAAGLSTLEQVPGRLEIVLEHPAVLRDYAHTPDALARALEAVRPFATRRLIVVFGCGGDRDRGKRPEMGRIAEARADLAIVTSDNPRTEDPERILDDIEAGMTGGSDDARVAPHERIVDRREAIARALALAGPDDVVLLAGKGHETYQVRGTTKYPFDERQIVRDLAATVPR